LVLVATAGAGRLIARKRAGDALPLAAEYRAWPAVAIIAGRPESLAFQQKMLGRPTKFAQGHSTCHERRLLFHVSCGASYSSLAPVAGPDLGRPATRYGGEALAALDSGSCSHSHVHPVVTGFRGSGWRITCESTRHRSRTSPGIQRFRLS